MGFKQSEALNTVERLDLWNEHLGWEIHDISSESTEIQKQLQPKGCFVMFNLQEFDFSTIAEDSNEEIKTPIKAIEENEDMQIDSSTGSSDMKVD